VAPRAKTANILPGELGKNPELQSKFLRTLLHIAAAGAMGGAGVRAGLGAVRNMSPGYEPPEPAKPVVIDMPYYVDQPVGGIPATSPDKEKRVRDGFKAAGFGTWLASQFPTYRDPGGNPGATEAADVPLTYALGMPAAVLGTAGGFTVADRLLRAAERRKATRELEDAKKEYHKSVLTRVTGAGLPAKSASDAAAEARTKEALDRAYALLKAAGDPPPADVPQAQKTLMSILFPGLSGAFGRVGSTANMGLVGGLGALGGYAGYNMARDDNASAAVRAAIKKRDQEEAEGMPSPLIARLVPVQRQA